ncbi:MAG: hypothetical protein OXM61_07445 [Candidatus Poribacteria bacterium]|nr:hypothetical protein [Candidatus Poribacteria bacterium]
MKTMKNSLYILAIAAVVTIYSTGAFVPDTQGIESTFDGFLVISDAEMAQHVGGPDEGHQRLNTNPTDHDMASCGSSNPNCDSDNQTRDAYLYACDNCLDPVFDDYDNTYFYYDKFSYRKSDGNILYKGLRISSSCREKSDGTCEYYAYDQGPDWDNMDNGEPNPLPDKQQTCEVPVGKCNDT